MVTTVMTGAFDYRSPFPVEATHLVSGDTIFIFNRAIESVCDAFGVTQDAVLGGSRERRCVYARHAFCSLIVNEYNPVERGAGRYSIPLRITGWRIHKDHSSVLHSSGDKAHLALMFTEDSFYYPYYMSAREMFTEGIMHSSLRMKGRVDEIDRLIVKMSSEKYILLQRIEQEKL